ncbi:Catalase-A [Pseudolycoriella hygida]|uniref:Catalase-A n=1 Tax=Pseudolycoriella hygida TaxID=35572 RepID=A0A9Q0S6D7_9DIPT|nr:Catalase-A [Pseudolycoriella hygida]
MVSLHYDANESVRAQKLPFSPFDATKYWNTTEFPLLPVGKLVLNRNPHNYFNDVEQAAFCPTRMVPGIEPTPDRILIARMFAYRDAQIHRLGVNREQISVNRCPFGAKNYERVGFMNVGSNGGNGPSYFPNTFHGPTNNNNDYNNELPFDVDSLRVDRIDLKNEDNFSQCMLYLNSLSERQTNII